jgi:tRNA G18 (ribose-2'-O)-methylase SpoU
MATAPAFESIADLLTSRPDLPVYHVTQVTMDGVTGFNVHRGCLAIGERPEPRPWMDVALAYRPWSCSNESGTPTTSAASSGTRRALGANAVLLGPGCADPLYRKAIRTSMGAALLVPFATRLAVA